MQLNSNIYRPHRARIEAIRDEAPNVKTFSLRFQNPEMDKIFNYRPGQFVQVSVLHQGEAPISITSTAAAKGPLELCIRAAGHLTRRIHGMAMGAAIGLRGPYGNGFPLDRLQGRDLVFVAGGIGLAPLRSLINHALHQRDAFGRIIILYGARTPSDMVFKWEFARWKSAPDVELHTTVDIAEKGWTGNVGVVTSLWDKAAIRATQACAVICGPPIMFSYAIKDLLAMGFSEDTIISTVERHMKCGVGKCGHCFAGGKYVCTDGPIFDFTEMKAWTTS
jgi:sulfhydrogenase subunit gamma (sulfur reductase)